MLTKGNEANKQETSAQEQIWKKSWCLQLTPDIGRKYINKENEMMIPTQ
jgi:hypothetical protein